MRQHTYSAHYCHVGGRVLNVAEARYYADVFTTANGQISLSFTRDDKGKIAGFVFNSALDDRETKGIIFKLQ